MSASSTPCLPRTPVKHSVAMAAAPTADKTRGENRKGFPFSPVTALAVVLIPVNLSLAQATGFPPSAPPSCSTSPNVCWFKKKTHPPTYL